MNNTMMIVTIILGIILFYVAWLEDKKEKQERKLNKERKLKIQRIVDRYKKEY